MNPADVEQAARELIEADPLAYIRITTTLDAHGDPVLNISVHQDRLVSDVRNKLFAPCP